MPAEPDTPPECYTDFALQEFIAGRLDRQIRADLVEHISTCSECRQALAAFQGEAAALRVALQSRTPSAVDNTQIPDQTLGLYLAGALPEAEVANLEVALTRCPALLARLIALRKETAEARTSAESATGPAYTAAPQGLVLRMPKRSRPVQTVIDDARRASGGDH